MKSAFYAKSYLGRSVTAGNLIYLGVRIL